MKKLAMMSMSVVSVLGLVAVAFAGDWSAAERKYEEFKKEQEAFKKLLPEETRSIVTAICEAEEAERKSAGAEARSRVEAKINDKDNPLRLLYAEAEKMLREVQADESLEDYHSKAKEYEDDARRRWESTQNMRGINHPVTAYMVEQGQKEHENYQQNSSNCHVYEFTMESGRADCLIAAGSTCYVVELKPDNTRAINKGRGQANGYAEELNKNTDTRKKLIDKDSRFSACTHYEPRVDCYKLCPELDEDNNMKSTYPIWRSRCS